MSPIKKIKKRDGSIVDFSQNKITEAIWHSAASVGGKDKEMSKQISNQITAVLEVFFKDENNIPTVEQIQDLAEKILIEGGHAKTAKAYILYRERHKELRKTQEDVLDGKITKLPFTDNALKVLAGRYLERDAEGKILESPEERIQKVATTLANVEQNYNKSEEEIQQWSDNFYNLISSFKFMPAGRTLANAGGKTRLVANCIVIHPEDSMEGIFNTLKDAALLQQAGSGLGFPWHLLRPAGQRAKITQGVASGPISFLRAYNEAFGVIKQQGRHGANMGVMRVDHPDILEFIECKWEEGSLVNFNISVSLTDEFMEKVKTNSKEPWHCTWNGEKIKPRRIIRNDRGAFVEAIEENITAPELMDKIINAAWRNGEPGVLFPDAANKANPIPALGRLEATNPCGEQWLHDGDVCNLGSLNLAKFVKNEEINEAELEEATQHAVRLLDNVIDLSDFPAQRVNATSKNNRRVGLGIMGFADMLYQMRVPYNSERGRDIARRVMKFINKTAHEYSQVIAEEKGCFPNWDISIFGPKGKNIKMRNAALTTVAPTGSISMLADCSSGVEPFFALAYMKQVMGGQKLMYINPHLEKELERLNLNTEKMKESIHQSGTLKDIKEIPEETKKIFVTSMEISEEDHIKMQAAFQEHVDNSISKTINFPNSATREDVRRGYVLAWELGLKGCTVYRDGSRQEQVLHLNKTVEKEDPTEIPETIDANDNFEEIAPPPLIESSETPREHTSFNKKDIIKSKKCPECGEGVQVGEGCMLCLSCGFSACSV
ncbi:adenosylcobalamin-dependent ribonucleoside-diphosphate reductase [Patescibacteria group bacterium]|nr:adenosylcobalamin-dependent ribonucleoside-diphosphate reductase [Patescibacteria group bacterium]